MDSSILEDIKKMLGIQRDYTVFDTDIIVDINAAIGVLNQIGVGVEDFFLTGYAQRWIDFLGTKRIGFQIVKQFVYLKTKAVFDPPTSGAVLEANNALIEEYKWRLNVMYETAEHPEEGGEEIEGLTPDQMDSLIPLIEGDTP